MYNGVGLSSARGSGTSAHVTRNSAALRRQRTCPRHVVKKNKTNGKRTKAAEEHERRRAIEVKVSEFEDEKSVDDEEVRKFRERLLAELVPNADTEKDMEKHLPSVVSKVDSRNDKVRRALGLPEEYEEGAAFRRMKKDEVGQYETLDKQVDKTKSTTAAQRLANNKSRADYNCDNDSESSSSLSSSSLSSSSGIGKETGEKGVADKAKPSLVEGRIARPIIPNPTADWLKNNVNIASVPQKHYNNTINTNIDLQPRDTTATMRRDGPHGVSKNASMNSYPNRSYELEEVHRKRAGLPPIRPTAQNEKLSDSLREVHRRRVGLPPAPVPNESHQKPPAVHRDGNANSNRNSTLRRSAEKELEEIHRRSAGIRDNNDNDISSGRRSAEKELDDVHRRRVGLTNMSGKDNGKEFRVPNRPSERSHLDDKRQVNGRPRDDALRPSGSTEMEGNDNDKYHDRTRAEEPNRNPDTGMKSTTELPKRRSRFGNRRMSISPTRNEVGQEKSEERVEERREHDVREDRRDDDGRRERRYKERYDRGEERHGNEDDDRWRERRENEDDGRREDCRGNRRKERRRESRYRSRSRSRTPSRSRSRSSSRDSYRRSSRRRRRRRSPSPSLSPPRDRRGNGNRNSRRMSREALRRRVLESMKKAQHQYEYRPSPSHRYCSSRSRSRSRSRFPPRRDRYRRRERRRRRTRSPSPSPSRSRSRSRSRSPRRMSPGEQKRELEFRMRKLKRRQRGRSESPSSASSQPSSRSRYDGHNGNDIDCRYRSRSPERKRRHL